MNTSRIHRPLPARLLRLIVTAIAVIGACAPIQPAPGAVEPGQSARAQRARGDRVEGRYEPARAGREVVSRVSVAHRAGGVDLSFKLTNNGTTTQRLGALVIGPISLGRDPRTLALGVPGAEDTPLGPGGPTHLGVYPGSMYAPLAVVESDLGVVGLSLQFDVLERRHEAGLSIRPIPGRAREWELVVSFDGAPPGRRRTIDHPGTLEPGRSACYTVSVRRAQAGDWRSALQPYRAHFESAFGAPRYQRDRRPVRAFTLAGRWAITPDNPRGFVQASGRPDQNGWAPIVDTILDDPTAERVMLWTPTGVFRDHNDLNFPFQFTTAWTSGRGATRALADALRQLPRVADSGRSLGLWWGRSAQIMRAWDDGAFERFDPSDPAHREAAFAELDGAVAAGATIVGLDAFAHYWTPVWDLHAWLLDMQRRAPEVKFVTEGLAPDFMHVLAPTCTSAYVPTVRQDGGDTRRIVERFALADLLVPGHETWALMQFNQLRGARREPVDAVEVASELQRIAEAGYVPVAFTSQPLPPARDDPGAGR